MKLVSFGDVHMATRNLERMDGELRDTDLIVISGDLDQFRRSRRSPQSARRGAQCLRASIGAAR